MVTCGKGNNEQIAVLTIMNGEGNIGQVAGTRGECSNGQVDSMHRECQWANVTLKMAWHGEGDNRQISVLTMATCGEGNVGQVAGKHGECKSGKIAGECNDG